MTAAKTTLPVLGVPVQSKALNGIDSLLSIVQMPAGIPVGTLAIGAAGATNAALLAAAILANKYDARARSAGSVPRRTDGERARPSGSRRRAAAVMKIGIIGAGQLGRMLALAGYPLGLRFVFLDQSADAPGAQVGRIIPGAFDDRSELAELAREVDVVTFDVENVPVEAVADDRRNASRSCRRSRRSAPRRIGCTKRRCSGS